ncbi:50S ribosomal protein L25 [Pontibacillus halophilus JSM 076056 = DSM 19796]|uniref:Large ribosomal subunit protein bL25 n=1 Tax=Pontibacillus halophilus JSM 076056 = DSM 19796 TaxID=1385510 RepID=A0A0A5I2L0_9BACI|nr:50S ribosomal protein L25/general stress protein Ctc [Pontibacillus halophilus]KGX90082.1 50S ribosomal protein L25 [Pontibacillus halophilus JSM 076056 = DSM 19796]
MAVSLKANVRTDSKRSTLNKLRSGGRIPGIVYGKGKENTSVSVDNLTLIKTLRDEGKNVIISLDIEGDSKVDVMLHDYQIEALRGDVYHVDFYAVDMSSEIDVNVPVHLEGEAQGVKDGGILSQPLYELAGKAKPTEIPESITVDISKLEVGDSVTVADLPKISNFEITEDEATTIANVLPPTTEEVVEPGETQDGSVEPELVDGEDSNNQE